MPLPPQELPEGLSEEEYDRFALLYLVMERIDLSARAKELAAAANRAAQPAASPQSAHPEADPGSTPAGSAVAMQLLQLLMQHDRKSPDARARLRDKLREALEKNPDQPGGATDAATLDQRVEGLLDAIDKAGDVEPPPQTLPPGLTAEEYYDLCVRYQRSGWTQLARYAGMAAMGMDPDGIGKKAHHFMRSKIPICPVPPEAEQKNIVGFNQLFSGNRYAAKETFQELIRDCPEFEWPHSNLGASYLQEGNLPQARVCLDRAVQLNPYYVNAWMHLIKCNILESRFADARSCIEQVREIDPDEKFLGQLEKWVEQIEPWAMKNDCTCWDPAKTDPAAGWAMAMQALEKKQAGRLDEALADYDRAIELAPKDSRIYCNRAILHTIRGAPQKALADYAQARQINPDDMVAFNNAAWVMATSPVDEIRDGARAVELATEACRLSRWRIATFKGTLAATYAECGRFEEAIQWMQEALQDPLYEQQHGELGRQNLKLFEQKKPYREV